MKLQSASAIPSSWRIALVAAIERRGCRTVVGCSWALLRGLILGGFANLPARDRVLGRARYGGDKFMVGRLRRENAVVATKPQDDDAVCDRAHIFHVVADHDDAEARAPGPARSD